MADLELEARRRGCEAGRHWLDGEIERRIRAVPWPRELRDEGGESLRLHRWVTLQVETMLGAITISQPSYERVGAETLRPVEAWLGLRERVSPGLQMLAAQLAADLPFREAERLIGELTPARISDTTIREIALDAGKVARVAQRYPQLPADFDAAQVRDVQVQIDGGMARAGGWREARVASIRLTMRDGAQLAFALTAISCAAVFWQRLDPLLRRLGTDTLQRLAFIADGGIWILDEARRRFPRALCVLDFWHLAQHIHEAAAAMWGEGSETARAWAKHWRRQLRRGRWFETLRSWRALLELLRSETTPGRRNRARATALRKLIDYVSPRIAYLQYPRARRRKLPIGSGRIESMIRQLLALRVKRPGCRWRRRNASRMLALRAARLTNHLDAVCVRMIARRTAAIPAELLTLLTPEALIPDQPAGLAA